MAQARAAIEELVAKQQWPELNDRFYRTLEFGTGGMRGRTAAHAGVGVGHHDVGERWIHCAIAQQLHGIASKSQLDNEAFQALASQYLFPAQG